MVACMLSDVILGKEAQYFMFPLQYFYIAVCQQIAQRSDLSIAVLTAEEGKQGVVQLFFFPHQIPLWVACQVFYLDKFPVKPPPCPCPDYSNDSCK